MSFPLPTSVGTAQDGIPVVPSDQIFKYPDVGDFMFRSRNALLVGIAAALANPGLWQNGQGLRMQGDPRQAIRIFNGTDAKTVLIGMKPFTLVANDNTITLTNGAPTTGLNQGDLKIDVATGLVYQMGPSTWGAGVFGFAVTASAPAPGPAPVGHRYLRFQMNAGNGDLPAIWAVRAYTADGTEVLAGLTYERNNLGDYPGGDVLTNGHTNASNSYATALPASATFDLTTPRAIDHITIDPGNTPVGTPAKLPTDVSILTSDDDSQFTLLKQWANITTGDWGSNSAQIIRTFSVA